MASTFTTLTTNVPTAPHTHRAAAGFPGVQFTAWDDFGGGTLTVEQRMTNEDWVPIPDAVFTEAVTDVFYPANGKGIRATLAGSTAADCKVEFSDMAMA